MISETNGSTEADESGTTDTFTVVLDAQPTSDVLHYQMTKRSISFHHQLTFHTNKSLDHQTVSNGSRRRNS